MLLSEALFSSVRPLQTLHHFATLSCTANTSDHPFIALVQQQKGIYASLLVFDDGTEAIAEGELTDTLSVLANFQALQTIADQTRT